MGARLNGGAPSSNSAALSQALLCARSGADRASLSPQHLAQPKEKIGREVHAAQHTTTTAKERRENRSVIGENGDGIEPGHGFIRELIATHLDPELLLLGRIPAGCAGSCMHAPTGRDGCTDWGKARLDPASKCANCFAL